MFETKFLMINVKSFGNNVNIEQINGSKINLSFQVD